MAWARWNREAGTMNNAARDELAALCLGACWCASEPRIVRRRVEVRPGEVGVLEGKR